MPWAFPKVGIGVLGVAGLALLLAAIAGRGIRTAAVMGAVFAMLWAVISVRWATAISPIAWWGLSALVATWVALFAAGASVLMRMRWWVATVPVWWVAVEQCRCLVPWGGFPWLRLAFVGGVDILLPAAWLLSAAGLSLLLAMMSTAAVAVLRTGRWKAAVTAMAAVSAVAAAAPAASRLVQEAQPVRQIAIAYVQPSQPRGEIYTAAERATIFDSNLRGIAAVGRQVAQMRADRGPLPAVIALSEDAMPADVWVDSQDKQRLNAAVDAANVPVLAGVVMYGPARAYLLNRSVLWQPGVGMGEGQKDVQFYDKRHLVPFGEFVPLRSITQSWAAALATVSVDFKAGATPGIFVTREGVRVGTVLCFETAYDDVTGDVMDSDVLAVQTNNGAFLGTEQPDQQFEISRVRAAEAGRPLVVAAATGVSGVIDRFGRVVPGSVARDNRETTAVAAMDAGKYASPARIASPVIRWGSVALSVVAFLWWAIRARRRTR